MQRLRVFATGLGGNAGAGLARALVGAGLFVRALRHRRPLPAGVEAVDGDLTADWVRHAALDDVDAVVHFGALMRGSHADLRAVNVDATGALAHAARTAGVRCFVLASTAAVYAPGNCSDADETHAVAPSDDYGTSKLYAERAARAAFPDGLVCLRPCGVYDDRDDCPLLHELLRIAREPLLPRATTPCEVVHADDLGQCVVRALTVPGADGAYNVAGPDRPAFATAIGALAEIQGLRPRFVDPAGSDAVGLPPEIVAMATIQRTLSTRRARRELGYAPTHGWSELLACARRFVARGSAP